MKNTPKKKILAASLLVSACLAAPLGQAADSDQHSALKTETKKGLSFMTGALTGAAAGGPIGFIIGAIGGAYIGETIEQADLSEETHMSLSHAHAQIFNLEQQLKQRQQQLEQVQQLAWHNLEFQLLFNTGSDELSDNGRRRIHNLANFLQLNPELQLRLDGYADPRGSDEYNNVLAQYRASNVQLMLEQLGIEAGRIQSFSHGAKYSGTSHPTAYAQERRVSIEVFKPDATEQLVSRP